ncbi:Signal transducer regulating beta-lactamase production, contains metallopeptidase domain [Chitinophaga sp. CF118]|uniref:M56 family metallopeptidase n=1 Tax=Chitinophaga sp. CF118 TaxID=1884367 RepID=UPI0008ECA298|nr:M56 family metallopeptidase [Chitinophaga sp. CF118]SFD80249.1 Signal transducer regulating beta-lactamase production, contains metallopeptidase domain [Chitinophaga sp. CF118]
MYLHQLVQAFSWMLIHSLWQGLLLAIIAGVVLMLTKRSSAAIRYNLVFALLLLFVCACIFTFMWEWNQYQLHTVVQSISGAAFFNIRADIIKTCIHYFSANAPIILCIWFIFFIARTVRIMGGLIYISRARHRNIYSPGDDWKNKMEVLCEKLQLKKAVLLLESGYVKMPLVIGHFKPVILIPVGLLAGLPISQVEAVLLHELAHIRRNDYFVNILQNITEAIFFFNPGLLWISSLLRDEREHCCDDIALAQTKNKREFIEALISFKEHSLYGSNYAVAFPGRKDHLLQRVSRILHNRNNTLNPAEKLFFMAGILLLGVMITAAGIVEIRTIVDSKPIYTSSSQIVTKSVTDTIKRYSKPHKLRQRVITVEKREFVEQEQGSLAAAEEARVQADIMRVHADILREQAERDKEQADKDRVLAELDRVQAEKDREQANKDREQAVLDRQRAMKDRIQADKDREQAERDREHAMKERARLANT